MKKSYCKINREREDSTATTTTMLHSSEDSPKTDASPSPPMASLVLAAACNRATKVRGRLKRAQSERTYDLPINLHNNHNNNNYRPLLENDSRLVAETKARKKIQDN